MKAKTQKRDLAQDPSLGMVRMKMAQKPWGYGSKKGCGEGRRRDRSQKGPDLAVA